jgi:broad specificity phosphatase PhoE
MALAHFITHPEVAIDAAVPITEWPLSPRGVARARLLAARPAMAELRAIVSSAERKAVETAAILAGPLALPVPALELLGENDRSATGYLPRTEFEATADLFFAHPGTSIRGWERAVDAQARIVAAVEAALAQAAPGDVAIVAHGGVGALLLCHLTRAPISRAADQPGEGGGNLFTFDRATRALVGGWRPIEEA